MAYRKTIELFLADGDSDGLIIVELSNWNGRAIKIPRAEIRDCQRLDITEAGVYFLFCNDAGSAPSVYIGESENVKQRLLQHIADNKAGSEQYYWQTAVIFIGSELNKALIRFLENKLVKAARSADSYEILTKNTYADTVLKESQKAAMEEFYDNICLLINTLGYKVFAPSTKRDDTIPTLHCTSRGAEAKGLLSNGGFTVLKGSKVAEDTTPSFEVRNNGYFNLRNRLIKNGTISDWEFTTDFEFSSPSAAASVIMGSSASGNAEWKNSDGVPLKNLN